MGNKGSRSSAPSFKKVVEDGLHIITTPFRAVVSGVTAVEHTLVGGLTGTDSKMNSRLAQQESALRQYGATLQAQQAQEHADATMLAKQIVANRSQIQQDEKQEKANADAIAKLDMNLEIMGGVMIGATLLGVLMWRRSHRLASGAAGSPSVPIGLGLGFD